MQVAPERHYNCEEDGDELKRRQQAGTRASLSLAAPRPFVQLFEDAMTTRRNRWNPRKLLVASAGVATVNYALATGCEGNGQSISSVANLMPAPGAGGSLVTVANLVAPPGGPNVAPVPLPGTGGTGGSAPTDAGEPIPASDIADASSDAAAGRSGGRDASPQSSNEDAGDAALLDGP